MGHRASGPWDSLVWGGKMLLSRSGAEVEDGGPGVQGWELLAAHRDSEGVPGAGPALTWPQPHPCGASRVAEALKS